MSCSAFPRKNESFYLDEKKKKKNSKNEKIVLFLKLFYNIKVMKPFPSRYVKHRTLARDLHNVRHVLYSMSVKFKVGVVACTFDFNSHMLKPDL